MALEVRFAEDDDGVLRVVSLLVEKRQDCIWRIDREAVLAGAPQRNEAPRRDVPDLSPWAVGKVDGRVCEAVQGHGPLLAGRAHRALNEQRVDPLQRSF